MLLPYTIVQYRNFVEYSTVSAHITKQEDVGYTETRK